MDFSDLDFKFQEIADPKTLTLLDKIGQALVKIYTSIPKQVVLPKIFQIQGKVEVTKQSPIVIANMADLGKYFQSLEQKLTIWAQASSTAQPPTIEFPKFDFPKSEPVDLSGVTSAIQDLQKSLQKVESSTDTAILRKIQDILSEFTSRPTLTTPPVTNVTINALNGVVKTSDNSVGTTLTPLPQYGQLPDRRALMIYNNSANTIYWGGSDVTVTNGIPITAGSFASPVDAGYNLKVYAIAASSGNDVRTVEISKDISSSIQE